MRHFNLKNIFAVIAIILISFGFKSLKPNNYIKYVDPFIGSGGHGHVFVGANVPFGGVQVGPTNFNKGWDWSSSYHYTDSIVKGFCHLNVSGTGMSDLGELTVMPATGELKINAGTQDRHLRGMLLYIQKTKKVRALDTTKSC